MNFNYETLATREELAEMILFFFDSKDEAKRTGSKDDWADHYRVARDLRDEAYSIIRFKKLKENEKPEQ